MDVIFYKIGILFQIIPDKIEKRCFQAAETVIKAGQVRDGKLKAVRVALFRIAINDGTARIRQTENLSRLVESLAGGVVDGASKSLHIKIIIHLQQQRMTARNSQAEEWERRYGLGIVGFLQKIRQHVCLQVIHLYQGDIQRVGHSLREGASHEQRTEQTGAICKSDGR